MKNIYSTLEFDIVKKQIEQYAKTERALRLIRELQMFDDEEELKDELGYLDEMISYTVKYRALSIYPHNDIYVQIKGLEKDSIGSIELFYQVSSLLGNIEEIKEASPKDDKYPRIMALISSMVEIPSLKNQIDRIITPSLEVSDNASSALRTIRNQIRNEQNSQSKIIGSLLSRYKDVLNSDKYTFRDEAYVLPVKATNKNSVSGIVVDESDSGLTVFIEPTEILESNSKIARLKEKEFEEIQKILAELSSYTIRYSTEILLDLDLISKIDFLLAKAHYALEINGEVASLTDERKIMLKNARHPLIDKKKVVANSFFLDKEKIMVISGPNAGGKTVALKVIGLLVLMNQCGLALPTSEKATLCYFDNIYVDMGDNQSLLDNLSTFSGHIKNLTEIIDSITDKSLVILDELGTGTSPLEGEALGVGVIEHLHELGCFGIFTSHYEGLKNFALEHDYILNASMAFDEENISPTYHLRLGVAGKSYGIALATRMNLNHDVLSKAQVYLDEKVKTDKDITLQALNQKLEENEGIRYELLKAQEEIEKQKHHLDNEIEKYKRLENKIFLDSEKKKDELIKDAKEQIDAIVEEMKQKENFKLHEVIGAKKKLDDLSSKEEDEEEVTITINVGDNVRMIDSDISGKVIKLKGENVTILTDRGMNLNVKLNQLEHYVPKAKKKQNMFVSGFRTMKSVPLECNIVGEYVEEGIQIVDKYLDDCVSVHYKECRIIHGHGTGKLREAVHKYLDTRKDIKSYRLGGMGEGGVGATVVYFK